MPMKKITRLEDLDVQEVSIVDRAANKRRFLMVKADEETMPGKVKREVTIGDNGEFVSVGDGAQDPNELNEPIEEIFKGAGEALVQIEKKLQLSSKDNRTIFRDVGKAMSRLRGIIAMSEYTDYSEDDESSSDLVSLIGKELVEISVSISSAAKSMGYVAKKDDPDEENENDDEAVLKAVWPTALVNEFPDSSFLYIKPGGKKDASGKTVPRSNRMFPVKDGSGKVDPAHVRNAIARAPQANVPDDVKARVQAEARRLLSSASKTSTTKSDEPQELEKRGAKMSAANLSEFKGALEKLLGLMSKLDVQPVPASNGTVKKQDERIPTGRNPSEEVENLMAPLLEAMTGLAKRVGSMSKVVKSLQEQPQISNVIPNEIASSHIGEDDDNADVSWPLDMNR